MNDVRRASRPCISSATGSIGPAIPAFIHNVLEREGPFARPDLITPLLTPRVALDHLERRPRPDRRLPEIFAGNPLQAPCVVLLCP